MNQNTLKSGYSDVNSLKMYYEIYGSGYPLVLIHGGGSTIQSSFGNIIPLFARNHKVIAMELQAHGRTGDRSTDLSFEQDADDVAALLKILKIEKPDFLGFSNGGHTVIEIALRYPDIVHKLIIASAFFKRSAADSRFWEGFDHVTLNDMPAILRKSFLKVNNNPAALLNMFNKDVTKMKFFKGWSEKQMKSIKAPTLVINGNQDVGSVEHAVEMYRIIPNCELAILPGKHGAYLGTLDSLDNCDWRHPYAADLIEEFLSPD
jgi:pimeloyl-ACP methyl ester carboxylesterase